MALRLITPAAAEPISLADAKRHLRVDSDDDDWLIEIAIKAARDFVEGATGETGRALVTQTWDLVLDSFPEQEIKIPLPPLQEIVSIKYDNSEGVEQTIDPADYVVDSVSAPFGWVVPVLSGWPTPIDAINAVRIRFIAGYPAGTDSPIDHGANVPGTIRAAMLLIIGALYANAEEFVVGQTVTAIPLSAQRLLSKHRVHLGMA